MNPTAQPRKSLYYIGSFFIVMGFVAIPLSFVAIGIIQVSFLAPLSLLGAILCSILLIIAGAIISKKATGSSRVTGFTLSEKEIQRSELTEKQNFYRRAHAEGLMSKDEMEKAIESLVE